MSANPFDPNAMNLNADLQWNTVVLGAHLRRLRKKRGCSLSHLQMLSGVDMAEIHRVEKGEQECRIQSLMRLCAALGTTPGWALDQTLPDTVVKRREIQDRVMADSDFVAIKARLSSVTRQQIVNLTSILIDLCQAVTILSRASNPIEVAKPFKLPNEEWQKRLVGFSEKLATIGEDVERATILSGLLSSPVKELNRQGLLLEFMLMPEGIATLPKGELDGWITETEITNP